MAIKLNKAAYDHAVEIIKKGLEVEHDTNNWTDVNPSRDEKIKFLNTHSLEEYGLWFLGIDTDIKEDDSSKFIYPIGDFSVLHKSGLLTAEQQATQKHHHEIKSAAQKLLEMINKK